VTVGQDLFIIEPGEAGECTSCHDTAPTLLCEPDSAFKLLLPLQKKNNLLRRQKRNQRRKMPLNPLTNKPTKSCPNHRLLQPLTRRSTRLTLPNPKKRRLRRRRTSRARSPRIPKLLLLLVRRLAVETKPGCAEPSLLFRRTEVSLPIPITAGKNEPHAFTHR